MTAESGGGRKKDPLQVFARERVEAWLSENQHPARYLSEISGVAETRISDFRKGRDLRAENLSRIAKALGLTLQELRSDPRKDAEPESGPRVLTAEEREILIRADMLGYGDAIRVLREAGERARADRDAGVAVRPRFRRDAGGKGGKGNNAHGGA